MNGEFGWATYLEFPMERHEGNEKKKKTVKKYDYFFDLVQTSLNIFQQ